MIKVYHKSKIPSLFTEREGSSKRVEGLSSPAVGVIVPLIDLAF